MKKIKPSPSREHVYRPEPYYVLSAGDLMLVYISFLIANDDVAREDLLIGFPVLQHLKMDTRTPLKNSIARMETDYPDQKYYCRLKEVIIYLN